MEFFHGKRIVVTGAAGFVGANLVRSLRRAECTIVRVLHESSDAVTRLGRARIEDVRGDVRERGLWIDVVNGADVVFHLAAQTSASAAQGDPTSDFEHNVLPMRHLLGACGRRRPAIVFASTVTIAAIPDRLPVDESFPDGPITVYDRHKKMAEDLLEGFPSGVSLRLPNVYGPGPASRKPDRGILNVMMAKALDGQFLTVFGDGRQIRDYLFVEDAARAFLAAARHADGLGGRHFVLGTGQGHTVAEAIGMVAARVAARAGVVAPVQSVSPPAPPSPIEARDFIADSRRFREAAGWQPRISLHEGIDRTLAALQARALTAPPAGQAGHGPTAFDWDVEGE